MSDLVRELLIAIVGAIIGAVLIYVFQFGIDFTQKSRGAAQAIREKEERDWRAKDFLTRQAISNAYLFSILKLFMIGNMLWVLSSLVSDFEGKEPIAEYGYAEAALDSIGLVFFLASLAKIFRFTKLQRMAEPAP